MSSERVQQRATVVAAIIAAMGPLVGETMARSSANLHLRSIEGEMIAAGQLEMVLARIGSALNVFVGRERAMEVVAAIRRTLEGGAQ